jgi:hypothetical protein
MALCKFDHVIFFTNHNIIMDGVTTQLIREIKSKDDYSHFLLKEAYKYISTKFVLVTQHDSWVLNSDCFDEELYEYDYAGALWIENDGLANGNGGFSWRSHRLMEVVAKDKLINATAPEDVALCRVYRRYLENNYYLSWAPDEICEKFSFELRSPLQRTFGFHSYFHEPYREMVVIRRLDAMGDTIQVEPVLEHFHKKGYRVVLETLPQFEPLFQNHHYPVLFPRQIDPRVLSTAKRYNLTMSYESNPKQLHLKSYYDFCEVPEEERVIRNPRLNFNVDESIKLFKRYCVIHIDKRETSTGRNVEGIDWSAVIWELEKKGLTPIQIGKGDHISTGALEMKTITQDLMCYLIAGCDLFIGCDSGPANIALATGRKMITFHGAVDPSYIYPDMTLVKVLQNHHKKVCNTPYCWSSVISTQGTTCYVNPELPPCTIYDTSELLNAINEMI